MSGESPAARPRIIAIINITRDSFSDGGRYLEPERAIAHAEAQLEAGADAIELGAESSHPDSERVGAKEEIARLEPVIEALSARGVPLGVDSWRSEVQRYCLARGVDILNDIQGFADPALYVELAQAACKLVVMHSVQREGPATRTHTDASTIFERVVSFLRERVATLTAAGIAAERLIVDPGMGYFLGDKPEPSLEMLRRIGGLRAALGVPVMVCVSRKSFLGAVTGRPVGERGAATLAAELFAARAGVEYIRTHDAAALRDALAVEAALRST